MTLPTARSIAALLLVATCVPACSRSAGAPAADAGAGVCAPVVGAPCCAAADGGAPSCGAASQYQCAGLACSCLAQVTAVYDSVPLARLVDGTVWVSADRTSFAEIMGPTGHLRASDVAASGSTAYGSATGCAIVDGGSAWCFPLAGPLIDSTPLGAGQGAGVTTSVAVAVVTADAPGAPPLVGARQLAASMNGGAAVFCAVTTAGGVSCWGFDVDGILGRGDGTDASFARAVLADAQTPFADAAEIRLGFSSACARKTDGSVWCWGDDSLGQVGVAAASGTTSPFPVRVPLPGPATRLAAAPGNTQCAILAGGQVACWGWNAYAQAGADATSATVGPTIVLVAKGGAPLTGVVDLAPDRGMQAMCASTATGGLVCWGHPFQALGQPDTTSPYPIAIPFARTANAAVRLPLSSFGARDGALVYADPDGRLTLGAGAFPVAAQPMCPGVSVP